MKFLPLELYTLFSHVHSYLNLIQYSEYHRQPATFFQIQIAPQFDQKRLQKGLIRIRVKRLWMLLLTKEFPLSRTGNVDGGAGGRGRVGVVAAARASIPPLMRNAGKNATAVKLNVARRRGGGATGRQASRREEGGRDTARS